MPRKYYTLPLRPDLILDKKRNSQCTLAESIHQNLNLIISTYQGESAYSDEFGCSLWNEEFNIHFNPLWKENLVDSLLNAISKFERRLLVKKDDISVSMEELVEGSGSENLRLRRALHIRINAILNKTDEPFPPFRKTIYISPVSEL